MPVQHHPHTHLPARRRTPELCVVCGDKAEYLCDAALAIRPEVHFDEPVWSCDAPLCASCRRVTGRHVEGGGEVQSVDLCPYHTTYPTLTRPDCLGSAPDDFERGMVIPIEYIDRFRGRVWRMCAADEIVQRAKADDDWCDEVRE